MVSVAHHTNGTRLHHHIEIEVHWILKPSFGESAENMPMSDLMYISARGEDESKMWEDNH